MNWQPIETAPKDGTEILLCMPGGMSDHFHVMMWDDEEVCWNSRYGSDETEITEEDIANCRLRPMWCFLEHPPTSLCYSPFTTNSAKV